MGQTFYYELPWPEGTQSNDVEADMKALAQRVDILMRELEMKADSVLPWGVAFPLFAGSVPRNCLPLEGGTYAQTSYPRLAALFGVTSGSFTLTDWKGYVPRGTTGNPMNSPLGSDTATLLIGNLPSHSHGFTPASHNHGVVDPRHRHNIGGDDGERIIVTAPNTSMRLPPNGTTNGQPLAITPMDTAPTGISLQPASAGGTIEQTGGNSPFDIIPKSRMVRWITRAL